MRNVATYFGAGFAFVTLVVACSSNGGNAPCTLTPVGASCTNDTDCCTGYCELYEDSTTACQTKPTSPIACVDAAGYCTQNRNCCSGLCQNNACFGGAPTTSCLEIGSTCNPNTPDSCCSVNCIDDGEGHTACTPQPASDGGVGCGVGGASCTTPGDDSAECCFGICTSQNVCAGSTTGGGGGGNCGSAGSFCRYGSDCCTGECEQVTSGGACQ